MTLATRLALLEAQTKASRTAEDAIRRARFKAATGQKPNGRASLVVEMHEFSGGYARTADERHVGTAGYAFGRSASYPILTGYRELKILHD